MENPKFYTVIASSLRGIIESVRACKEDEIAGRLEDVTSHLNSSFTQISLLRSQDVASVAAASAEKRYREAEARRLSIFHQLETESASVARHDASARSAAAEAAHFAAGLVGIEWELVNLEFQRSVFKSSHARAEARRLAEVEEAWAAQARADILSSKSSRLASLSRDEAVEECTKELEGEKDQRIQTLLTGVSRIGRLA